MQLNLRDGREGVDVPNLSKALPSVHGRQNNLDG